MIIIIIGTIPTRGCGWGVEPEREEKEVVYRGGYDGEDISEEGGGGLLL